jgi:hypothetical protein
MFRGPSPTPLGSGVARNLGQQGGALPSLAADPGVVQPVILIGDTSKTLSRFLTFKRGWAGQRQVVAPANVFYLGMRGYASGGIVIERIRINPVAPAVFANPFRLFGTPLPAAFFPGHAIAGTDPNEFIGGATEGVHFGQGLPNASVGTDVIPGAFNPNDVDIFVGPGFQFTMETNDVGVDVDWHVIWREVPE